GADGLDTRAAFLQQSTVHAAIRTLLCETKIENSRFLFIVLSATGFFDLSEVPGFIEIATNPISQKGPGIYCRNRRISPHEKRQRLRGLRCDRQGWRSRNSRAYAPRIRRSSSSARSNQS